MAAAILGNALASRAVSDRRRERRESGRKLRPISRLNGRAAVWSSWIATTRATGVGNGIPWSPATSRSSSWLSGRGYWFDWVGININIHMNIDIANDTNINLTIHTIINYIINGIKNTNNNINWSCIRWMVILLIVLYVNIVFYIKNDVTHILMEFM